MRRKRKVEPKPPSKKNSSISSTSREVNMDMRNIDIRKKTKIKVRDPLTPLTPRIAMDDVDVSKIEARGKTKIRNVRHPLIPLTPRVAISVTDVENIVSHKNENVHMLETLSAGSDINDSKCENAKKYASLSEESNSEEEEPFVPSDSEYYPSDSDSVFDSFDDVEKSYTFESEQNISDANESEQRLNIFTSSESNSESDINIVITPSPKSLENTNIANSSHQHINPASKKKWSPRYHFCPFCRERVTRFARHVLNVHKTDPEVIEINVLPPNSLDRYDKISALRKKGMYEYNTNPEYNGGDIIVNRRPKKRNQENINNPYIPCKNCKGYYRTSNLPKHYKKCSGQNSAKGITRCGRMLSKILLPKYFEHIESILKKGRTDNLSQIIFKDRAILYYGAKLASKYMHVKHMDNHIRSNMRLLARLLVSLKRVDPSILCLIDAFKPSKMEVLLVALRDVCQYDHEKRCFKNPSRALHFSGILLKCCEAMLTHFIQNDDEHMRQQIDNFRSLVKTELSDMVRIGHANLIQNKLTSLVPVPVASDICKLNSYLRNLAETASIKLQKEPFSYNSWYDLASCTLVLLLIFNRRRTGETERLSLDNYNAKSTIIKGTDIYESLEKHEKILSDNFYRLEIRGKWGRSVPLLLTKTFVTYIDQVIALRETAGVATDNPYVFGVGVASHLSACKILREVSNRCGASNPNSLRGTYLRKQIATVTQIIDMSDSDIKLLSQFMGHSQLIHEQSYRKTDSTLQIARLSKLLIAFNEGQLNRYKGCSLDQLDIDLENEALVTRSKNNITSPTKNSLHDIDQINDSTCRDQEIVELNNDVYHVSMENSPHDFISNNAYAVTTPKKQENQMKREKCRRNLFQETPRSKKQSTKKTKILLPKLIENRHRIFVPKLSWTTPERQAVRKLFAQELKSGVLPPFNECIKASLNEPALRRRSAKMIYAYVNNLNKINKK